MIKKIPFLILFLVSAHAFSQNWQTVVSNRQAFFKFNIWSVEYLRSATVDSIEVNGNDSLFFFNRNVVQDVSDVVGGCMEFPDSSFLGYGLIIKPNGDNTFLTGSLDSVMLRTQAALNNTWRVMNLGSGTYMEGKIDSIISESFLGITDSVKYIGFLCRDSLNNIVPHPINYQQIKLSKNNGLLQTFSFINFPELFVFTLRGISNPSVGIQNLTASQVFDFNVGDMFQWIEDSWFFSYYTREYSQVIVLSKNVFPDSVLYTEEFMLHHHYIGPGIDTTWFVHDTITKKYIWNHPEIKKIDQYPHVLYNTYNGMGPLGFSEFYQDTSWHNRRYKILQDYFYYDVNDDCVIGGVGFCNWPDDYYVEGLGLYGSRQSWPCRDYQMVHYQKGAETWGMPMNWSVILSSPEYRREAELKIFPNPFVHELRINSFPENSGMIRMINQLGECVLFREVQGESEVVLNTTALKSGFYTLCINTGAYSYYYKVIKL